jgi:hypothetical protein
MLFDQHLFGLVVSAELRGSDVQAWLRLKALA